MKAAYDWCDTHQKQTFKSRKIAKQVCRNHRGEHKVPFPCTERPREFHIGGLPKTVIRGQIDRARVNESNAQKVS